MAMLAAGGATHVEPGNGLHGTTALMLFDEDQPEVPAIAYISEVSHLEGDDAYVFGAGLYIDKVLGTYDLRALVGRDEAILERAVSAELAPDGAIHYYAKLHLTPGHDVRVGDTAIFCFRPQVFVTRARTRAVAGIRAGAPLLGVTYDVEARPVIGTSSRRWRSVVPVVHRAPDVVPSPQRTPPDVGACWEGVRTVDVLVRPVEPAIAVARSAPRAPWQTRFSDLPAAPTWGGLARVTPIAIPVIGGRPINGRHLVRAPWTEPLSAFAGVIVGTQLVPDAWISPRSAARRAIDPLLTAATTASPVPVGAPRRLVAIPIVPDRVAVPIRVTPMPVAPRRTVVVPVVTSGAASPTAMPASVTALGRAHPTVPATSAAPIEPVVPSPVPTTPAPARRGRLGRAVGFAAGLVVTFVAAEAAVRLGRR